ncbi:MAG: hypothetical protein IKK34_13995 [Clostridia bacterium]|nr:hypothetical protein [Clostridia bacterium]
MKTHMTGWEVFFKATGVLSVIGAAGSLVLVNFGMMLTLLAVGLGLFMTASVCAWMDDIHEMLQASNRTQADIATHLLLTLNEVEQMTQYMKDSRMAARSEETVHAEGESGIFNAQNVADAYRMSQK